MKNVAAFLKRHSALLLLVLVLATVPAGVAFGKYVKSVNVTSGISIDVQMKEYVLEMNLGRYIHDVCALPNKITICKKSELPNGLTPEIIGGKVVDLRYDSNSGSIYIYKDSNNNIYIAPADSDDAVVYAPVDASKMFHVYNGSGDGFTELDTHNLNTSRCKNMSHMFDGMKRVTHLDLSGFDTSNVTDMSGMFYWCTGLTSIKFGGEFDTSNVKNMSSMFSSVKSMKIIDLSEFDTQNVTDMSNMFTGNWDCLNSIIFGEKFTTAKVTNMSSMFEGCYYIQKLDLSGFDTSNVTDMSNMFHYTGYKLYNPSVDLSSFNTSNVTTMNNMFSYAGFKTLDLSSFNTQNVTDMAGMFTGPFQHPLKTITVSDAFVTTKVPDGTSMFGSCRNLVGGAGTTFFSTGQATDVSYAHIDGGTSDPGYFTGDSTTYSANGSSNALNFGFAS